MAKLYQYTRLFPDGTSEELEPREKMSLEEYQAEVGGFIEIVPSEYYEGKGWGRCTVYCNEEGRFSSNPHRNRHFNVLGPNFYIVGTCLKE